MPSTFYDFHLRFESAASDRWEVVAQCEPRGTTDRAPLRWPVLPAPLETAWAGSVGVHRDLESAGGSRDVSLREVGEALSEAALTGDVGSSLRVALEDARRRGLGLRIWVHGGGRPELERLPWEALWIRGRFLAQSESTPIVRFLEDPEPLERQGPGRPLRVLLAAALPHDREPLGVERELDAVVRAFKARELGGDVVIESFPRATLAALRERLDAADRPCHVVHFIGHAGFAAASREGVLVFEDDGGGSRAVGARQLGPLLLDHDALQLLVLNSCWGARAPREGGSPGLAQALMRQRVPAVIAMQTCIDDTAAIAFAKHFYSALAAGHAVDVALAGCRKGMASDGDGGGWAAPVVYLRAAPAPLLPAPRPPEGVVTQKSVRPVVAPPGASAALVSGVAGTRVRGRVSRAAVLGVVVLAVIAAAGGSWLAFELRGRPGLTPSASSATFRAAAAPTAASPTSEVPECSPVPEIAMKFMRLGPGTFLMGSPHGGAADERPAHYVTLSPFCVGAYEVTRGQWLAVMGSAATPGSRREDDLPMESVSWDDVQLFLGRLNDLAGRARYRLPTEAEWEYAARAGSGGAYSFGDDPGDLWRFGNCKSLQHDDGFDRAAPVGSFLPNRWGLYDLYGNVSEWVEDAYGRYGPDPVRDPHLREGSLRVRRGGSWAIVAKNCRSAFRNKSRPDTRKDDVGFRLVRLPD